MKIIILLFATATAVPLDIVQNVAENDFEKLDNYLAKGVDFPKFHYSTMGESTRNNEIVNEIEFKSHDKKLIKDDLMFNKEKYNLTLAQEDKNKTIMKLTKGEMGIDPINLDSFNSTANRTTRQREESKESEEDEVEVNNGNNDKEKESQESEEEETPNMLTGLISAFLGGLSRPDGGVDIEAITGLLGSLSVQREDGTYDFNGLTEILQSFFGGGDDGGGSDFGAFIGGLVGAFLKGIAQPPGARGVGVFLGNTLNQILPALSAPAPNEDGTTPQGLDSGGFLSGLLSSLLGSIGNLSGGISTGSSGNNNATAAGGGKESKFSLFKTVFSSFTGLFSKSSHPQQ